jgi:hypothetical protein
MLVGCDSFAGDQIGCVSCLRTRLIWLPPRVAFFLASETRVVIAHLCLLLLTPLALPPQKVTHVPTTTLALSLSYKGHSLDLCAQMSPPACPVRRRQLRALWGSRLISLLRKLALQQAGRPRARRRKGPERTSTVPSSSLLPRPRRRLRSSSSAALAS